MHPTKQTKLLFEVTLLQRHHEPYKSYDVECEAYDTMICGKWEQLSICKNYVLIVGSCKIKAVRMKIETTLK
jgi:hypothetical protein